LRSVAHWRGVRSRHGSGAQGAPPVNASDALGRMTLRAPRATGEDHMADTAIDLIDQQNWLNSAADALQPAVHQAFDALGESGRTVKDALHGVWLGHPVHPALTDVPIGAWTTALVFDTLEASGTRGFARAADAAIAVGLVGAVGAAITGLTDWSETDTAVPSAWVSPMAF
jgi:hypothetical protein